MKNRTLDYGVKLRSDGQIDLDLALKLTIGQAMNMAEGITSKANRAKFKNYIPGAAIVYCFQTKEDLHFVLLK